MLIKFTQAVRGHWPGDVADMDTPIATLYIARGLAKKSAPQAKSMDAPTRDKSVRRSRARRKNHH